MARKTWAEETLEPSDLNSTFDWAAYEAHPAKANARAASTANLTLSGEQTVDGVSVVAGDRVLVKNQTDDTANGIYTVGAGDDWARSADAATDANFANGVEIYVEEGTANGGKKYKLATTGSIVVGVTNLSFTELGGAGASTPTGTGFPHITAGVQDGAAKLVEDADVSPTAAIAQSKIANLTTDLAAKASTSHTHSAATTSAAGFMSAADKLKLDNATANATASTLASAIRADGSKSPRPRLAPMR